MKWSLVSIMLTVLGSIAIVGCSILAEPEWAKLDATSDLEQLTDGSMYTTAQPRVPQYVKGETREDSRFTEAIVKLRSPQEVRRIVIRRRQEDSVAIDVNVYAKLGEDWKVMKEIRGEVKNDIDIRISPVKTDQIKVEVQRAARTADGKSAISVSTGRSGTRRVGGQAGAGEIERLLREPVKIAEIEIYGLGAKQQK